MTFFVLLPAFVSVALCAPTIYFKEEFDDNWAERWVQSKHKGDQQGKFKLSAGKFYGDPMKDRGLQTSENNKFYSISAKFDKFSNEGKTLIIQFTVKHEQFIECGGGYVKLFASDLDQADMNSDTPYLIMFGPDICGSDKKVHVIFNYKGKNLQIKKDIKCKFDVYTHIYTLIVRSDNTYEVRIDNRRTELGDLEADWEFLLPRKMKDPRARKPSDWDEREMIDDPTHIKPEDWDDEPERIPDEDATMPEDWDFEMDGKWEPPMIDNPEYKGVWKARQIENPKYQGEWEHPMVDNPDYEPDDKLYLYRDIGAIGFDLWQVKSGTIFDNILITDDEQFAKEYVENTWGKTKDPEKKMKSDQDQEEARKKQEEEDKKRKQEEDDRYAKMQEEEEEEEEEFDEELDDRGLHEEL